jgi:ATP-dependent Lhr-like helicase
VRGFRPEWLDQLTLTGEVAWGRLWGGGNSAVRSMPITLLPREDLEDWLALAFRARSERASGNGEPTGTYARTILEAMETRGPSFAQELLRSSRLLPAHFEMGLTELIGHGLVTCDSFGGLRRLITSPSHRRGVMKRAPLTPAGRWSGFRTVPLAPFGGGAEVEFAARQLLRRYGVVFRKAIERERIPVPWRDLVRVYRLGELRGDVRGGRFVQRFAGEQYALPEAVELMRRLRRKGTALDLGAPVRDSGAGNGATPRFGAGADDEGLGIRVSAGDPLNLDGILTPEPRIPAHARRKVLVG